MVTDPSGPNQGGMHVQTLTLTAAVVPAFDVRSAPKWVCCARGWRAAHVDRVRAGSEWLEVRRFSITQAGRQLLGQ
jgi:hypothetical protein